MITEVLYKSATKSIIGMQYLHLTPDLGLCLDKANHTTLVTLIQTYM